jgi:hypothetical protein
VWRLLALRPPDGYLAWAGRLVRSRPRRCRVRPLGAQVRVGGIECAGQLGRVAPCLGEHQPTLNRRHRGRHQRLDIGVGPQLLPGPHRHQPLTQVALPAVKGHRQLGPGRLVGLGQLRDQRADRAASTPLALDLERNQPVEPGPDGAPAVERLQLWLLGGQQPVGLMGDDRPEQVRLVLEVVVELTLADPRALDHRIQARLRSPALANQRRGRRDDPGPGGPWPSWAGRSCGRCSLLLDSMVQIALRGSAAARERP